MTFSSMLRRIIPGSSKRFAHRFSASARLARQLSPYLCGSVCIDVGASYYPHTKWEIFLASPETRWVAVEPNEKNLGYVKQWHWPSQVSSVTLGLSRAGGPQTLHITNIDSGSSLLPPVISPNLKYRVTNHDYFFPVRTKVIETLTLSQVVEGVPVVAPVFVKLDTQGTELSILQGAESLLRSHRIIGIEMEATLLAQPIMQGAGKLWEACQYLEDLGFEMLRIDPIYGPSRLGIPRPQGRTFLNECDAVFAVRQDIAATLAPDYRLALMAFGLANGFFEDALVALRNDAEVRELLERRGCNVSNFSRYIRALA